MKRISKTILFSILSILILICLSGCGNKKTDTENMKIKVEQELDYLDIIIVSIANKLNNIKLQNYTITSEEVSLGEGSTQGETSGQEGGSSSGGSSSGGQPGEEQKQSNSQSIQGQTESNNVTTTQMQPNTILDSDENDIDWKAIKNEIEIINDSWTVIILDLTNLNVNNDDILNFSNILDTCILSIKNENKEESLTNIAKLYSLIPSFEREISSNNSTQNIKQVKAYLINAYAFANKDDWTSIGNNISECERTFRNLTNDIEYMKDREYKVNKTYVLIKELQNSLTYKDKKLFYLKYKDLIESINTL